MTLWTAMLDEIVSGTAEPPPFVRALRLPPIEGWGPGHVWGSWKVDPDTLNGAGTLFGGYLASVADSVLGLAMMTVINDGEIFTTSDLRVSYFRPVTEGTVEFAAEVVNRGRRMAHCEVVFVNDSDKVVAKATATQVIMPMGE